MMFRKLYWVTESVARDGRSHVTGVYTSIPDLIRHGLGHGNSTTDFRLTLTKLDSEGEPLGCWLSPRYEGLSQKLEEFILTDEFSKEHCNMLLNSLVGTEQLAKAA